MNETSDKKKIGVLLIRGGVIDFYIPSFSPSIYTFQFTPTVYSEMEITNLDLATRQLIDFFILNKIPATEFVLIIQNPLFKKEFPLAPQEQLEASINTYLDYVPFDSVLSKRVKTEKGVVVVTTNGNLFQDLRMMFGSVFSSIECITPLDGLSIIPKGGLSVLTQPSGEVLLKNVQLLKQESFSLTPQRSVDGFEIVGKEEEEEKKKSILPIVIPVFVILLIILVYVYSKSQVSAPSTAPKKTISTPTP